MPELPEVEVVRRGLERHLTGRTIALVQVLHARAVRRHAAGPEDFASSVTGRRVAAARRRGKYLWFPLDRDGGVWGGCLPEATDAVLAHLGMSGQLLVGDPRRPLSAHVRVRFAFADDGADLRFTDQRTFGHLCFVPDGAVLPAPITHIAADPLEPAFDEDLFAAKLTRRRSGIKRALLDQSLVSGIGNIYADESLWRAQLHWATPSHTLARVEVASIVCAVRTVLRAALESGGTSFDSLYVNVNGESGYFDRSLAVYGRAGRPCPRCGAVVRRDPFMNRSAYSCPRCQPLPHNPQW